MTIKEAKVRMPTLDTFCAQVCDNCLNNNWYCYQECNLLVTVRALGYDNFIKLYTKLNGDVKRVCSELRNQIKAETAQNK